MNTFIGYTCGLMASKNGISKLVKVEYSTNKYNGITLQVVSGYNLEKTSGKKSISKDDFNNRPHDPYNNVSEATWALGQCGWSVTSCSPESKD
jgi:hypothetical protein